MRNQRSNKLWLGILGGAVAGIAISLLDRNTRNSVMSGSKNMMTNVKSVAKNPDDLVGSLKEMSGKLRTSIEQISEDVAFISSKVDEMKEVPPQVAGVIKETKEVVVDKHTNDDKNSASSEKNATPTSIQ
ncbi:YtxH domain-containing protein [Pradoshia sp.]